MNKNGFTLLESVIALAFLIIIVTTMLPILSWLISRTKASAYEAAASLVLQETMEVSYNVMSVWPEYPDGTFHPAINVAVSPETWILLSGEQDNVEAKFTRWVEVLPVCRDQVTGERVMTECNNTSENRDSDSKLLKGVVEWQEQGRDKSIAAELLVVNMGAR
jgi:type II secretory pathway pseudopilin PulG